MKRIIISCAILVVMLISMASCSNSGNTAVVTESPTPTLSPAPTVLPTPTVSESYAVDINKVAKDSFALFGTIDVNNYKTGARVDRNTQGYQPFYIVNRHGETKETKRITTNKDETVADIPIKQLLHNGDLSSVIGIESDLSSDRLVVIGYVAATNSLTISGFDADKTRIAVIRYIPDTVYRVTLDNDKNKGNYLIQYFALESARITVAPDSWEPIYYSFMIPEGIIVPADFSIWIYTEATYVTSVGVDYNIGYYAPIKIKMAE